MIAWLKGKIITKKPNVLVLDVHDVGYRINISFKTFQMLKDEGETEEILIYTLHKEDLLELIGFKTKEEKELFKVLLSISGIGPKMALGILSKVDMKTFQKAVSSQDISLLTGVGGIGKKRAEKLLFELKEKFKKLYGIESVPFGTHFHKVQEEAVMALEGLGYSKTEAFQRIKSIAFDENISLEDLIKKALSGN
ncbi:MAG: Holliday junction branch migration protein RuvA [Spirochaetes bacterium]|nr:Holliday junction branch migration protein RuvA [Spirochaetota bacterium]